MIDKKFLNSELEIELNSYFDNKQNVWFRGKDVAKILGYKNTDDAIRRHVSKNHKMLQLCCYPETGYQQNDAKVKCSPRETRGQQNDTKVKCSPGKTPGQGLDVGVDVSPPQQNDTRGKYCIFIEEPGFYELVFSSKLEFAKKFRDWVFSKVLPSIRKFGYYKLFKIEGKNRVIIDGKKYYKHPVFSNYAASKNGDIMSLRNKKILKMRDNGIGYLYFSLCDKRIEKPKNYYQHRFVYEVFKGLIPSFLEIDHINYIKKDNRIRNLQLISHKKNIGKSRNKTIISTEIKTGKERKYISIKAASIELDICDTGIIRVCRNKYKTATSKKDGKKYTFKYLDYN